MNNQENTQIENMKEENSQDMELIEEDKQQNEVDEKIMKRLSEIKDQYKELIERKEIHKEILKEIKESEENKQIESKDKLKSSKKILMEIQIKLEKFLLSLDSLVGASEKVRPQKKGLVIEIQGTISEIDLLLEEEIKPIEMKIEQHQLNEKKNSPPTIEQETQEEKPLEQQKSFEQKPVERKEEESGFPFPSKEDWEQLKFEPKFNVQQLRSGYVISSMIPDLDKESLSVKTNDGVLVIEGVKYPTSEEQQLLAKKLIQTVGSPHLLQKYTRSQISSAILKLASQYNFGKFSVKYELPSNVSEDDINFAYKNGLLQIDLPTENKPQNSFSQSSYRPEVPFYGYNNRRPNNSFWNFF